MGDIHTANDPVDIFMWQRIDHQITTSGQPSETQLATIHALGVTHVVNLGLHDHHDALPDEEGAVRSLGIEYRHIPVDFDHPTEEDFGCFRATMRELEGRTIHIHCIANLRVSAFLYRYRRDMLSEAEARKEMERIWRPGGVWAKFIGDEAAEASPHHYTRQEELRRGRSG